MRKSKKDRPIVTGSPMSQRSGGFGQFKSKLPAILPRPQFVSKAQPARREYINSSYEYNDTKRFDIINNFKNSLNENAEEAKAAWVQHLKDNPGLKPTNKDAVDFMKARFRQSQKTQAEPVKVVRSPSFVVSSNTSNKSNISTATNKPKSTQKVDLPKIRKRETNPISFTKSAAPSTGPVNTNRVYVRPTVQRPVRSVSGGSGKARIARTIINVFRTALGK